MTRQKASKIRELSVLTREFTIRNYLIEVAKSQVGVTENPPKSNRGLKVEQYLKTTGLVYTDSTTSFPWCASFVADVGVFTAMVFNSEWPLVRTASVDARFYPQWTGLFQDATNKGVLRDTPEPGAIWLRWYSSKKRFAHTGFCISAGVSGWATIEGNTNGRGSREGWGVFDKTRSFGPKDRFIYWWELLP